MRKVDLLGRLMQAGVRLNVSTLAELVSAAEKLAKRFPDPRYVTYDEFHAGMRAQGATDRQLSVLWSKLTKTREGDRWRKDPVALETFLEQAIEPEPPMQIAPGTWGQFKNWLESLED